MSSGQLAEGPRHLKNVGSAAAWLRQLTLVALEVPQPGTLTDIARVIGRATGSKGVVLWEAPDSGTNPDPMVPSVLSLWLERGRSGLDDDLQPDWATSQALAGRTIVLADGQVADPSFLFGLPVDAAINVDYADGAHGVLTLLGTGTLTDQAFDVAVDLLSVLPEVLTVRRERCTLALVNQCNEILYEMDVASPAEPPARDHLRSQFGRVCADLRAALRCTDVSLFLREPGDPADEYECLAWSAEDGAGVIPKSITLAPDAPGSVVSSDGGPLMQVAVTSGDHLWGVLRCTGAEGPPFHFTHSDLSMLVPVAAQLASYWANWLNRRTISAENASWRRLAEGITGFNKLVAEDLRGGGPQSRRHDRVGAAALQLVHDVVPDASGGVVYLSAQVRSGEPGLAEVAARWNLGASTDDPGALVPGVDPTPVTTSTVRQLTDGWLVNAPLRVAARAYGSLIARGPSAAVPANSVQVCEIIADQLGLYRHLEETMGQLHEAQHSLKASLRGQAEAMEDLKHQLVSPLRTATDRTDLVLQNGRLDTRAQAQLRAVRGLCRKASRVAMSAGVFAMLSKDQLPRPQNTILGVDDLIRMLIAGADDAQLLSNPRQKTTFDVDRQSVQSLKRQYVQADVSFLQQCIGNLLDNAGKYSYPGTRVEISGRVVDGHLALEVASTGLAVDRADAEHCLERNWRGTDARNWTGEGSGIGLWIVDNLMRSMNGRVEINPVDQVTTVRLLLPVV